MIMASYAGLPRSLAQVGAALNLSEDEAKMKEGKALITYFCKPCKPTKVNKGRTRNRPEDAPDKWETFKAYNVRDVETERTIRHRLARYTPPEQEWRYWWMDQRINDTGVPVDMEFVRAAISMADEQTAVLMQEAKEISGLENPNSVAQLKEYLETAKPLDKASLQKMLAKELDPNKRRMMEIRQELGKSSVKKYEAMRNSACDDNRVRGAMQFYKANRTGRWAGSLIQPQNFPRNDLDALDDARQLVLERDTGGIKRLFGSVSDTLSQLIRTAIAPPERKTFVVADFSAIEARVIAWLAGEQWRMDVFANGGDIYCASASQMFHVPVEKHGVNGHLRQKGKIAELALGYGGTVGAMIAMGAGDMGLSENECQEIVDKWRTASPNIVKLWWNIDGMTMDAMQYPGVKRKGPSGLWAMKLADAGMLLLHIPSGRELHYLRPRIGLNRFGHRALTYEGTDKGTWGRAETFGGKLTENVVQAIARDCLCMAMKRVTDMGYQIVFHVHDEMIVEVEKDKADQALRDMLAAMAEPIEWAPGLILKGDGYITDYYKKD